MFDWRLSKWSGQSIQHVLFLLGIGCGDEPLETPPLKSISREKHRSGDEYEGSFYMEIEYEQITSSFAS